MFKQRKLSRLIGILMVVLGLAIIAAFTPVIPWLTGFLGPVVETPQPAITPAESPTVSSTEVEPSSPVSSTEVEPSSPVEISQPENTIILSEEELQSKLDGLRGTANQSGVANIEYIRVKLEQDKMLLSVKGEAGGYKAEAEDLEIRFEGRTVFASGKVTALGLSPTLTAEAEVSCEAGKPSVEVKKFGLDIGLPLSVLGLSKDKISGLINGAIEAAGIEVPVELESIRIEDGKLIVVYK